MQGRKVLILLLLALVLVLAACGGDDNDDNDANHDAGNGGAYANAGADAGAGNDAGADAGAGAGDDAGADAGGAVDDAMAVLAGDAGDDADAGGDADAGDDPDPGADAGDDVDAGDDPDPGADAGDDVDAGDDPDPDVAAGADGGDDVGADGGDDVDANGGLLGDDAKPYEWENYGITMTLPAGWGVADGGQDYDLAFLSPEAMAGTGGTFLTFKVYPSLGDESPEEALQPLADEAGTQLEDFGDDGVGVTLPGTDASTRQQLILYPYGEHGGALFVRTSLLVAEAELLAAMLDTLIIDPPQVDVDAANAAFQASLAADGTLTYGDPDAPVVIREYYSFTCGHCATYMLPIHNLLALDVETGRVRFELAAIASGPKPELATHTMYCAAAQGQGFSAYEALFLDYLIHGYDAAYTPEAVDAVVATLDLDVDALNACVEAKEYTPAMDQVRNGFVALGLTGTPTVTFARNGDDVAPLILPAGQVWSGVMPLNMVRTVINLMIEEDYTPQEAANVMFGG